MAAFRFLHVGLRSATRGTSPGYSFVELMAFMALIVTGAAFILPFTRSRLEGMNLSGSARTLSNTAAVAKMRAAASFTTSRVHANLSAGTYRVQLWNKATSAWVDDGPESTLATTVSFGFAGLGTPPANTQPAIGQAPACLDDAGDAIANTACIVFNSRGIPVDATSVPSNAGAFYVSNGSSVFGVTASTSGLITLWRAQVADGAWAQY
jgi:hypothetical protein